MDKATKNNDKSDNISSDDNTSERFHYSNVIFVSIISGLFVLAWLVLYEFLNKLIWENAFVVANRWVFPVLTIFFSLVVGIAVKYFKAPNSVGGTLLDSMSGGGKIYWKILPVAVLNSLASLLSGAVVGPEGAIGHFAVSIAGWFNEKFKIPGGDQIKIIYASLASAYNGLIESPIFTAVLANDIAETKKESKPNLPANLIAGTIGYFIFFLVGSPGFSDYLGLPQLEDFKVVYMFYIILFALIGLILAVYIGIIFKVTGIIFSRFSNKIILRALIAGVIIGITGYFFPIVMFSGETQIFTLLSDPTKYGVILLFAMALLKILLLGVSFKSGFLGGPTFPAIFASTAIALAINIIFPQIPLTLIVAGIVTGVLMMMFKTPFMVILLTVVFLSANTNLVALIILAAATVMIIGPRVELALNKKKV